MDKKIVFIMGAGHSGSTLLGLILGSHSRAFGLGEVVKLGKMLNKPAQTESQLCFVCQSKCEFWDERVNLDVLKRYFSSNRITRYLAQRQRNLFDYFFDWTEADMLVDFSKQVSWIKPQMEQLPRMSRTIPYVLYITRDGRAVTNSRLRKYPDSNMEQEAIRWRKNVEQMNRFYQRLPAHQKLQIAYERLATQPGTAIKETCEWLQIYYEPDMLNYWQHEHHLGPGNRGTASLIIRHQKMQTEHDFEIDAPIANERHKGHYEKMGLAIKLDLRWQQELTAEQVQIFEKVAGETNRPFIANFTTESL